MSAVIDLRAYIEPPRVPTLVLIDMQQEYVAAPRFFAIPDIGKPLANCRAAFAHAHTVGLPVAFVRWAGRSSFFNAATRFSRWIDGFQPVGADMIFERGQPSCYASPRFADVMEGCGANFVIAGFAGEAACLATAIDAYHRGHRFTFLSDATASHALDGASAENVHDVICKIVALYGEVMPTAAWIAATSRWNTVAQ